MYVSAKSERQGVIKEKENFENLKTELKPQGNG